MSVHLNKEIAKLKKKVLQLTAVVEESVRRAVSSVDSKDEALAEKVIADDNEIDRMEIELEEECLKILALHQPVAIDLRYVIACLKINNDLERIDELNRGMYLEVERLIIKKPKKTSFYLHVLGVSRQLERIADYTTNIAEDVIYMIEGKIVRHMAEPQSASEKR